MTVRPVGNASANLSAHGRMDRVHPDPLMDKTGKNGALVACASTVSEQDSETPAATGDESTSVPGVLRLLQEGHFKGVADVRLRINFFEELNAMASENARTAGREELGQFFDTINARLETISETYIADSEALETINEAGQQFQNEVRALIDELNPGPAGSVTSALDEKISNAFERLVGTLQGFWAQPTVESTIEPDDLTRALAGAETNPVTEDPPVPPESLSADQESPVLGTTDDYDTLLISLRDTFNQSLSLLLEVVGSADKLPELSQPTGQGGAYQKFLAIYNEMLVGDQGHVPPEDRVETEA